jgi:uncharacterized protein (TIGR03546 family)
MLSFRIIRKIGKILRGGAGAREIFIGLLFGVLMGMMPAFNLGLLLLILLLLLLNANVGFALLGAAVGRLLALLLAPVTFQIGFTLIHSLGLEGLFRTLNNTPFLAYMGFDNYCQVGGFLPALLIGSGLGYALASFITAIRKQLLKVTEHEKLSKAARNPFTRFLLWLAFGKQKMGVQEVLDKKSPLLRKSGLILVAITALLAIALEMVFMDMLLHKSLVNAISASTGAEVNVDEVELSLTKGELKLVNLQVTDPDKLTHNMVQIRDLAADISIADLMKKQYTIQLLKGARLLVDEPRATPGALIAKREKEKKPEKPVEEKEVTAVDIEKYIKQFETWREYLGKLQEYLENRKANAEKVAKKEPVKADRKKTARRAKKTGYLDTVADNLVQDKPTWTIERMEIDDIVLENGFPHQNLRATGLSSHPELIGTPTDIQLIPTNGTTPIFHTTLHFEAVDQPHDLALNFSALPIGNLETGEDIPLHINEGNMSLQMKGTFDTQSVNLPFSLTLTDLKSAMKEGESIAGIEPEVANRVIGSLNTLSIEGSIEGSLLAPKVTIDREALTKQLNDTLVAAGKEELKQRAGKEINKLLEKEGGDVEEKTKGLLKKLF